MLPAKLNDLLASVECANLYEFLKLDPSATPEELSAAAQKEFDRIQNKGLRGGKWDARKELTGLCKSIFGDSRTKKEYDRAQQETAARGKPDDRAASTREFDEETALLESGWDLVRQGRVEETLVLAKRLTGDHGAYSRLRLTVAELMISRERYLDAINFIFWCEDEEPGNDQYKAMLGTAFARGGTATWTRHGGQFYATSAEHVAEARACLDRARQSASALGGRDVELSREIAMLEEHIRVATRRRWNGNVLTVIGGVLVSQFMFSLPNPSPDGTVPDTFNPFNPMGWFMLASTAVYGISSMEPQWKRNGPALQGTPPGGCLWYLVKAYLILMVLPIVAAWKFLTNFWPAYRDHRLVTSTQERGKDAIRRLLASLGRGASVLGAVGLLVLMAAILPRLFSPPNEAGGGSSGAAGPGQGSGRVSNAAQPEGDETSSRQGERPAQRMGSDAAGSAVVEPVAADPEEMLPLAADDGREIAVGADAENVGGDSTALPSSGVSAPRSGGGSLQQGPPPAMSQPEGAQEPVRVGGNVTEPTKVRHVPPVYPPAARRMRAQGVVILETVIGTTGAVEDVRVLRSVPLLDDAAITAVRQWRYTPTLLNDVPVPVVMTVTVNFTLQ